MQHSTRYVSGYARLLISLAWSVEIIAVLIGLTISIVVSVAAYNSFASSTGASLLGGTSAIVVSGLPFVLVAVVELCKIPLTFAFMTVRHLGWRLLFLIFVLFLCLITFETMLNGFERNFSNLNRAIDTRQNEIESLDSNTTLLAKRRDHVQRFTEDELLEEVEGARQEVDSSYRQRVQSVDANVERRLDEIDYGFQDELNAEIARLMDVRDEYYRDWRAESEAVEARFSTLLLDNISGSSEERDRLLEELEGLKREMNDAMNRANFFTRAGLERKFRELISAKEHQLATITTGYLGADAIERQATMESQLKQQLEFVNAKYSGRVDDINGRIAALKAEIDSRLRNNAALENEIVSAAATDKSRFAAFRAEQNRELDAHLSQKQRELEEITQRTFGIDEQIFGVENEQRSLQTEISHLINQNQIHRLAMYAFGRESASEVGRREVGVVALVWFGSLALIASVCGVMLALAGFYLRRLVDQGPGDGSGGMAGSPATQSAG